jgi:hypothetical protein
MPQNYLRPASRSTTSEVGPQTSKVTPPRRKRCRRRRRSSFGELEKGCHLEDKDQTVSIPTKRLQGGPRHPKTPRLLTLTPKPGWLSTDTSPNADPTTKETMNHNSSCDLLKRKGRALMLPSTKPITNDTRIATSFPTRAMTDTNWKSPDLHQGTLKDGSSPQQPPTTTATALHTDEPPRHLGHEIGLQ